MRKQLLNIVLIIFFAFVILYGISWVILTFGNVSMPVSQSYVLDELALEGELEYYFDGSAMKNISGRLYFYGFRQPSLAVCFSTPQEKLGLEGTEISANEHLIKRFDNIYGVSAECANYYRLGCGHDYRNTGAHPHRYCAITQANNEGMVNVYYIRVGAEW